MYIEQYEDTIAHFIIYKSEHIFIIDNLYSGGFDNIQRGNSYGYYVTLLSRNLGSLIIEATTYIVIMTNIELCTVHSFAAKNGRHIAIYLSMASTTVNHMDMTRNTCGEKYHIYIYKLMRIYYYVYKILNFTGKKCILEFEKIMNYLIN